MAQAWHKPRKQLRLAQGLEAKCWRASKYELGKQDVIVEHRPVGTQVCIEAAPDARWERFSPFDSYRPTNKVRDAEAGPHLAFLQLKGLWKQESELLNSAYKVFATNYGLLGVFEEEYQWPPIVPHGKFVVAPEAVIDSQGKLREVDPDTEGKDFVWRALADRGRSLADDLASWEMKHAGIALPSEIQAMPKSPFVGGKFYSAAVRHRQPVPWEVIKEDFGVLLIQDEESYTGVSVLCTREPLQRWQSSLASFPSGNMSVDQLVRDSYNAFNWRLRQVSPYLLLGEDGNLKGDWHYRSLLQAMYVMLWLDLTRDNTITKCQRRGCPYYFRVGAQSKSKYCSERCANTASTRMGRGQEP
jgi:hypothetical protein